MSDSSKMVDMLAAGLRGVAARQNVIAGNIANVQTPGYKRRVIEFEKAMARAMASGDDLNRPVEARLLKTTDGPSDSTGNNVDLEVEVGELIENSAKYKAYMRILHNVYKQMELAMSTQ